MRQTACWRRSQIVYFTEPKGRKKIFASGFPKNKCEMCLYAGSYQRLQPSSVRKSYFPQDALAVSLCRNYCGGRSPLEKSHKISFGKLMLSLFRPQRYHWMHNGSSKECFALEYNSLTEKLHLCHLEWCCFQVSSSSPQNNSQAVPSQNLTFL